ncbi:hypothetical protein C3486_03550 [Streptomyces sp. Ru73]|uniref:hypothetical protein n=1 Tax=Streptomyces sp. Ru73 TaxID=2080748 RepID=UPI000CDD6804|nr:hypothetical protein [Streptomyces sp. Ru73]POX42660.1 hypothetical protein C3486_03550 [Streptomyces sp. Ru73]
MVRRPQQDGMPRHAVPQPLRRPATPGATGTAARTAADLVGRGLAGRADAEALAVLQRSAGNAALARVVGATGGTRSDRRTEGPSDGASLHAVQRLGSVPGGSYPTHAEPGEKGPHFMAQEQEAQVVVGSGATLGPRGIPERVRYPAREVKPAEAGLRVADDGTLAVLDKDEPKEFYAVGEVVDNANASLAAAGSIVRLALQGRSITVGERRLSRVQPVLAQQARQAPPAGEEFVSLVRSTCITVACRLMGSDRDKTSRVVLGGGAGGFEITPGSDSDARVSSLAGQIATTSDGGLDVPGAVDAAEARDRKAPDNGRAYGEAIRDGGRDATAARLGVNQYASPGVGEGFAIFSMAAQDERDHSVSPPAARGDDVWGYHFAAVVASSLDGTCRVTLENYARNDFDRIAREELYDTLYRRAKESGGWFSGLSELKPEDGQQAFKKKFDDVLRKLCTDPAIKDIHGLPRRRLQEDFEDHTGRAWFFRVYGGGPGESFHEQQSASGYFNNPLTVRVAKP